MTRAHKITFLAAAILGLSCGGYLGHRSAIENGESLESMQYIAPTKVASDFARTQFMHSDTDHAPGRDAPDSAARATGTGG